MNAALTRELRRTVQELRALAAPPAPPDPVTLFRRAFGAPDAWQEAALRADAPRLMLNVARLRRTRPSRRPRRDAS